MSYYPSQPSYSGHHHHSHGQPVMYSEGSGYVQSGYGGVPAIGVPVSTMAAPVMVQQSQAGYGGYQQGYQQGYGPHHHWTFGQRVRRFFGLAPTPNFKYKSDRNTWGFMGYSRRQRYVDARTGAEVDRHGRQVIRV